MKAVIFDMDGVIIDSEPIHFQVEGDLLEELGGTFDKSFHETLIGTTDHFMWTTFKEKFNIKMPIEKILELKKERFYNNLDKVPLVEGIEDIMTMLDKGGYTLALASSNNRKAVDGIISKFHLDKYLQFSISGDDVKKGKPDPEIFLTTAKTLDISPSECLVIEDAENGVLAAKAAGMKCIGYKNPNSGNQDLSEADMVIENYNELDLDVLKALFI